jgi:hypothetical protein
MKTIKLFSSDGKELIVVIKLKFLINISTGSQNQEQDLV